MSRRFRERADRFLLELRAVLEGVDEGEYARLESALAQAPRLSVFGVGRSGEILRAFAAALGQIGRSVQVVLSPGCTALGPEDRLLLATASGGGRTLLAVAEEALIRGARVHAITANPISPIARLAETRLTLPPLSLATEGQSPPMGPLHLRFDQALLAVLDALALDLETRAPGGGGGLPIA